MNPRVNKLRRMRRNIKNIFEVRERCIMWSVQIEVWERQRELDRLTIVLKKKKRLLIAKAIFAFCFISLLIYFGAWS